MRGTVKRTEGMFAGATMEDVENDYDSDEESGPFQRRQKADQGYFSPDTG